MDEVPLNKIRSDLPDYGKKNAPDFLDLIERYSLELAAIILLTCGAAFVAGYLVHFRC